MLVVEVLLLNNKVSQTLSGTCSTCHKLVSDISQLFVGNPRQKVNRLKVDRQKVDRQKGDGQNVERQKVERQKVERQKGERQNVDLSKYQTIYLFITFFRNINSKVLSNTSKVYQTLFYVRIFLISYINCALGNMTYI